MSDFSTLLHQEHIPIQTRRFHFTEGSSFLSSFSQPRPQASKTVTPTPTNQHQRLMKILQKDAKRELPKSIMQKQLSLLYKNIFLQIIIKLLLSALILVLLQYLLPVVDNKILVYFFFLIACFIVKKKPVKILEDTKIITILKVCEKILYFMCFYLTLKATYRNFNYIDWALTVAAIQAVIYVVFFQLYAPYFNRYLSQYSQMSLQATNLEGVFKLFAFVFVSYYNKVKNILKIKFTIVVPLIIMAIIQWVWCFQKQQMKLFSQICQPKLILISLSTFIIYDFIFHFLTVYDDMFLFKQQTVLDGIHVFISLLRLQNTSSQQRIHNQCLKSLCSQLSSDDTFLQIQTPRSFAYQTYTQIFHRFASARFRFLHSNLFLLLSKMKQNESTFQKNKSMKEDLFIYFRKAKAEFFNEILGLQALRLISNDSLLIITAAKAAMNSNNFSGHRDRIQSPVISLLNQFKQKCEDLHKISGFNTQVKQTFRFYYNWIQSLIYRIDGMKRMQEQL